MIAASLGVLLLLLRFQIMPGEEVFSSGDGKWYLREAAIQRNQELAARYEGPMTVEKVREIWEKYGPYDMNGVISVDLVKGTIDKGYRQSFIQTVMMQHFCSADYSGDKVEYRLMPEKELAARGYFDEGVIFTYTGDWYFYWDTFLLGLAVVCLLIIIGLSPFFVEDRVLRVADVAAATEHGRPRIFRTRILAGLCVSSVLYWLFQGSQILLWGSMYGWRALKCSTIFTMNPNFFDKQPLWLTLIVMLLCGWAAALCMAVFTMAVSSVCRQVLPAVLISIALFAGPVLIMEMFLKTMRLNFVIWLLRLLFYCMPLYFASEFLENPVWIRALASGIVLAFAALAYLLGRYRYCRRDRE